MLSLVLFASMGLAVVLIAALLLRRAARRRGLEKVGFVRCLVAALLTAISCLAIHAAAMEYRKPILIELISWTSWTDYQISPAVLLTGEILASLLFCWLVTVLLLRTGVWMGLKLWLFAWPVLGVTLLALHYSAPQLVEARQLNSSSMCPTLLGRSQATTCPECGALAYAPWMTDRRGLDEDLGLLCICGACRKQFRQIEPDPDILEPDLFVVNKLLSPRRWDMVLYRPMHLGDSPLSPRFCVVKRVIGLPGEEVVIKDGGVWINGERQSLPEEISGLMYLDLFEGEYPITSGSADKPAKLGADEYFVVGDYSYRSNDSRIWPQQLQGRPAFALPADRIEGVVDLRYFPWLRWQIFR